MDFSFAEFAIIGIVALLVIGPDKLPGVARTVGLWVGKAKRFIESVKTEIDAELKLDSLKNAKNNSLHEISEIIQNTREEFRNTLHTGTPNPFNTKDGNLPDSAVFNEPDQDENESTNNYQVKAIPSTQSDTVEFDDADDSAHHDVEDGFIDDYNSDYQIDEIETAPDHKAKKTTKAAKKSVAKKLESNKSTTKKALKKKTTTQKTVAKKSKPKKKAVMKNSNDKDN